MVAKDELATKWPYNTAEDKYLGTLEWPNNDNCFVGSIASLAEPILCKEINPKEGGNNLNTNNEECVKDSNEFGPKHELGPLIIEEQVEYRC